jgi:putative transposase
MIEEFGLTDADASTVLFLDGERTPAGSGRLACALPASAASLAEIPDILGWFGVDRSRPAIRNWCQSLAESHEQTFTAEPDRVAVDEKQVQLAEEPEVWLYAAIDIDSEVVLHARLSEHRGTDLQRRFFGNCKRNTASVGPSESSRYSGA